MKYCHATVYRYHFHGLLRAIAILVALAAPNAWSDEPPLYIGVLEDVRPDYVGAIPFQAVRVAFRESGAHWEPVTFDCPDQACLANSPHNYPSRLSWTISDQGRMIGSVVAETPKEIEYYSWVGLQRITSNAKVKFAGKPSAIYGGFSGDSVYRPLLATTGTRIPRSSTEGWVKVRASADDLYRVVPEFKRRIPKIDNCASHSSVENGISAGRAPTNADLEIQDKWLTSTGKAIVKVAVRERVLKNCDYISYPNSLWLFVGKNGATRLLPGQLTADRNVLELPLAFADVRGDGRTQVLFLLAGMNRGGYALFYDDFAKRADISWGYH